MNAEAREAEDFFLKGPGRKLFAHGSLVLLLDTKAVQLGDNTSIKQTVIRPQVIAVGVVVERKNIVQRVGEKIQICSGERSEAVKYRYLDNFVLGVSFFGESMNSVVKAMHGLGHTSSSSTHQLSSLIFNASAGFFTYHPVLKALQDMHAIPLGDTLVRYHPSQSTDMKLAHAGKYFAPTTF